MKRKKLWIILGIILIILLSKHTIDIRRKAIIKCVENGGTVKYCEYEARD